MSDVEQIERGQFDLDLSTIADQLLHPLDDSAVHKEHLRLEFVERVARGYGTYHAGLAVGWSEQQIRQVLGDPEMTSILETLQEFHNDTVEYAILRNAQAGNVAAQKMYALAKMPERGYVEKRTHVIEGQARLDVVHSVKEALLATITDEASIAAAHNKFIETTATADDD